MGIKPFKHMQLSDLSKGDAVVVHSLRTGVVVPEYAIVGQYPDHPVIVADLRTANLTAISIMAKIFY